MAIQYLTQDAYNTAYWNATPAQQQTISNALNSGQIVIWNATSLTNNQGANVTPTQYQTPASQNPQPVNPTQPPAGANTQTWAPPAWFSSWSDYNMNSSTSWTGWYANQQQATNPPAGSFQNNNFTQPWQTNSNQNTSQANQTTFAPNVQWNLSSWWATDWKWDTQPTLNIGWQTYKFNTPQEYIAKLQALKTAWNSGPIDNFIQQLQWAASQQWWAAAWPQQQVNATWWNGSQTDWWTLWTSQVNTQTQAQIDQLNQQSQAMWDLTTKIASAFGDLQKFYQSSLYNTYSPQQQQQIRQWLETWTLQALPTPQVSEWMKFKNEAVAQNTQDPTYMARRNAMLAFWATQTLNQQLMMWMPVNDDTIKQQVIAQLQQAGWQVDQNDPDWVNTEKNIIDQIKKDPSFTLAQRRSTTIQWYANMDVDWLTSSMQNGDLLPWTVVWDSLMAMWMWGKLTAAKDNKDFTNNQWIQWDIMSFTWANNNLSFDVNKKNQPWSFLDTMMTTLQWMLKSNTSSVDLVWEYKHLMSDPAIVAAQANLKKLNDEATAQLKAIKEKKQTLDYLKDDLLAQSIASWWWTMTTGYLEALAAEKSKPLIREYNTMVSEYEAVTWQAKNYKEQIDSYRQDAQYTLWLEVKQQEMASAEQTKQLQAMWFMYNIYSDQTANQRALELEKGKLDLQEQYTTTDMNNSDPTIAARWLKNTLDQAYKDYGPMIQRSQSQVEADVKAYAQANNISLSQAYQENFLSKLQAKPEYKALIAKNYSEKPTISWDYVTTLWADGKWKIQSIDEYNNSTNNPNWYKPWQFWANDWKTVTTDLWALNLQSKWPGWFSTIWDGIITQIWWPDQYSGIDIAWQKWDEIYMPTAWTITWFGTWKDWNNYVQVTTPDWVLLQFNHLSQIWVNSNFKKWATVNAWDVIWLMWNSWNTYSTNWWDWTHLDISGRIWWQYVSMDKLANYLTTGKLESTSTAPTSTQNAYTQVAKQIIDWSIKPTQLKQLWYSKSEIDKIETQRQSLVASWYKPSAILTDPNQIFKAEQDLAKEFQQATTTQQAVLLQWKMINVAWNNFQTNWNSALSASTQTIVNSFGKMVDPGSTVREWEYARTAEWQSLFQRADAALVNIAAWWWWVSADMLKQIVNLSQQMTSSYANYINDKVKQIKIASDAHWLNINAIIPPSILNGMQTSNAANSWLNSMSTPSNYSWSTEIDFILNWQ